MRHNQDDAFKELYEYMALEHGLIMEQTELDEVMRLCKKAIDQDDNHAFVKSQVRDSLLS